MMIMLMLNSVKMGDFDEAGDKCHSHQG